MDKMVNEKTLESFYQESLEERLIQEISRLKNISLEEACDFYYNSDLADKIYSGKNGIQYLDYKVLAEMAVNEPLIV